MVLFFYQNCSDLMWEKKLEDSNGEFQLTVGRFRQPVVFIIDKNKVNYLSGHFSESWTLNNVYIGKNEVHTSYQ